MVYYIMYVYIYIYIYIYRVNPTCSRAESAKGSSTSKSSLFIYSVLCYIYVDRQIDR